MKIDPFAPQLLRDYDMFCREYGFHPFEDYMACWYAVEALVESAEAEGRDPFLITVEDVRQRLPDPDVN